jgi:hypothetical protein
MKTTNKYFLAEIEVGDQLKSNPEILRVILSDQYTRIDFGYVAPWIYVRGGWITIAPQTFIKVNGGSKIFKLIEAKNIPLAPEQFEFESTEDWRVFSLYFEQIPLADCQIDIIEQENPTQNDFNFYNIKLKINHKLEDDFANY